MTHGYGDDDDEDDNDEDDNDEEYEYEYEYDVCCLVRALTVCLIILPTTSSSMRRVRHSRAKTVRAGAAGRRRMSTRRLRSDSVDCCVNSIHTLPSNALGRPLRATTVEARGADKFHRGRYPSGLP